MLVFVLNKHGYPLMPTSPRKARVLLKSNKAVVVKRKPFTIKLIHGSSGYKQKVICGVDPGFKTIGASCVSPKKELLSVEVELDQKTSERIFSRKNYRRFRRNQLRYRKPRFSNRTSRNAGWLPPSIDRKFKTHLTLINFFHSIIPISKVVIEVGSFDLQKIEGTSPQKGDMYGFSNLKAFLLYREKGKCQLCNKSHKKWNIHHIVPKSKGGTDRPKNLALLGKSCHKKLHKNNLEKLLKKNKNYKPSVFMSIINSKFCKLGFNTVFGYETFTKRNALGLTKTHSNDAFVIAGGEDQKRSNIFKVIQKRGNDRVLQRNLKSGRRIRTKRYAIRPMDLIKISGVMHTVVSMMNKGRTVTIKQKGRNKGISINKIDSWVFHNKSLIWI